MAVKKYKGQPYHLWNPFTNLEELLPILDIGPMMIVRGDGPYVFNERDDKFINCMSGLWNVAIGHGREELITAATESMKKLAFASCFRQSHPNAVKLAKKLVDITDGYYQRVYLGSNGSEAVETAIKMSRQYMRQSPHQTERSKYKIISLKNCYHGVSYGPVSTSGVPADEEKFGPLIPGFIQIEPPYCYRCPYKKNYPDCGIYCAHQLKETIKKEGDVAAFILEPVMGSYGMIPFPEEYYKIVGETCKEEKVLFIADEVTTGFGRTGKLFASQDWNPRPDILCLGKAISSGYLPVSATLATEDVYQHFVGKGKNFEHGCTNSGHPTCSAVALKNIEIIINEKIPQHAKEMGEYLLPKLRGLKEKHKIIGDVRGRGLIMGIELVSDQKSHQPMPEKAVFDYAVDIAIQGMLVYVRKNTIGLMPPLIIDQGLADEIVSILDRAFETGIKATLAKKARLAKEVARAKLKKN